MSAVRKDKGLQILLNFLFLSISLPFNFEPISRLEPELEKKRKIRISIITDLTARTVRKRACDEVVALAIGIAKPY